MRTDMLSTKMQAELLTKMDRHRENNIKIRPSFIIERVIILGVFLYGIVLCICYSDFASLVFCLIVLSGYTFLCILEPCAVRLRYTEDELFYQVWRTKITIPRSRITRIAWEKCSRTTGYSLVIYLDTGRKIVLHSMYYVGLIRMRDLIGTSIHKENKTGDGSAS